MYCVFKCLVCVLTPFIFIELPVNEDCEPYLKNKLNCNMAVETPPSGPNVATHQIMCHLSHLCSHAFLTGNGIISKNLTVFMKYWVMKVGRQYGLFLPKQLVLICYNKAKKSLIAHILRFTDYAFTNLHL